MIRDHKGSWLDSTGHSYIVNTFQSFHIANRLADAIIWVVSKTSDLSLPLQIDPILGYTLIIRTLSSRRGQV